MVITQTEDNCNIIFRDDLTIFQVEEFQKEILTQANFAKAVTVDLSAVEEMDSAGIQLLLSLTKEAKNCGSAMTINHFSNKAEECLSLFSLDNIVNQTVEE